MLLKLISDVLLFVCYLYLIFQLKQKSLIYDNRASLQHLLRNKLNVQHFACDKLKDIYNIYVYSFAYMNKLANQSYYMAQISTHTHQLS